MSRNSIDGLPIIDAKRPIKLHVTAADIGKADLKEPHNCAVARACRRDLHALEARIHLGRVYVKTNPGSWTRYITPKPMRAEIIAFDRGGHFEAGEFVLSAPSPNKLLGKRRGTMTNTNKKKSQQKKRKSPHVVKNVRTGPAN